ncbi:MAG: hypothetical protein LBR88_04175 [Zoogloeaceae bacterium]|jgi:hypothetical protein|nr:hypothetical protein [Zoogloeaceae bacterium]
MKPSRPATMPALLEGVFMRFAMLETLEHYSPEQLRTFADSFLHAQQYYAGEQGV